MGYVLNCDFGVNDYIGFKINEGPTSSRFYRGFTKEMMESPQKNKFYLMQVSKIKMHHPINKSCKMKILTHIILIVFIAGCSQSEQSKANSEKEKANTSFVKLEEEHKGFWVNEAYLNSLRKTKSTKKSGEEGVDRFYKIYKTNSIMALNIHEGGAKNVLLMNSKFKGQIYSPDSSKTYSIIEFRNGVLNVDGEKYIKAPDSEDGLQMLVNRSFFSGEYMFLDKLIRFNENATIVGLDSLVYFELNLDYIDAGMQFDKIYLRHKDELEEKAYLYEFNYDTLRIFNINCITFDEEIDYCVEVEKGSQRYLFIRK